MAKHKHNETNLLVLSHALRSIISVFLGPFLTAYFVTNSDRSQIDLSFYYIIAYLVMGFGAFLIGWLTCRKHQLGMLRFGVILEFIYLLTLVALGPKILNHIPLVATLYGVASIAYWFPFNGFEAKKVSERARPKYEFKKRTAGTITTVVAPVFLGGLISESGFRLAAGVVLVLSLGQIFISFILKSEDNDHYCYNLVRTLHGVLKQKSARRVLLMDFLRGLTVLDGALGTMLTIMIVRILQSDMNLGIVASLGAAIAAIFQCISAYRPSRSRRHLSAGFFAVVTVICCAGAIAWAQELTLVTFYIAFTVTSAMLNFYACLKLFKVVNSVNIQKDGEAEFWAIREFSLTIGRVISFALLIFVSLNGSSILLYLCVAGLTLIIPLIPRIMRKIR